MDYCVHYCEQDVQVLTECLLKFSEIVDELFDGDFPFERTISISGMAMDLAKRMGAFNDVYYQSGLVEAYIRGCVKGGKCMTARNEKHHVKEGVTAYDANSLYPSSMISIPSLPIANPFVLEDDEARIIERTNVFNSDKVYYLRVVLLEMTKPVNDFPLFSTKADNGSTIYHNDVIGMEFSVDNITYIEAVIHVGARFKVVDGIWFKVQVAWFALAYARACAK